MKCPTAFSDWICSRCAAETETPPPFATRFVRRAAVTGFDGVQLDHEPVAAAEPAVAAAEPPVIAAAEPPVVAAAEPPVVAFADPPADAIAQLAARGLLVKAGPSERMWGAASWQRLHLVQTLTEDATYRQLWQQPGTDRTWLDAAVLCFRSGARYINVMLSGTQDLTDKIATCVGGSMRWLIWPQPLVTRGATRSFQLVGASNGVHPISAYPNQNKCSRAPTSLRRLLE